MTPGSRGFSRLGAGRSDFALVFAFMATRFSAFVAAVLALGLSAIAAPARAQCTTACDDASGVVNLPANADISLPFKQGEKVYLLSGYGPTGGSGLHCRTQDGGCANDYFALDLNLPNQASSGKGQPVLAIADATVLDAGWASQGWANYGQRVYLSHDFGDGHKYTSMYAHLDSIKVTKGQKIKKGDVIGTLGQSCQGALSCGSFSTPHVHFSIHRDSSFGGTGSGGSYAGRAVRPEPFDGNKSLSQGQTLTSNNGGTVTPPPVCDVVIQPTGETIIEDTSACAAKQGNLSESSAGLGGHAYYAVLDVPDPDYAEGVVYSLDFAQAGDYDLFAWIPQGIGNLTPEAVYKTQYATAAAKVTVDQASNAGSWAFIGSYAFNAGGQQWVRLGDNYLSSASQGKNFVIDALKVAPAGAAPDGGAGGVGGGAAGTTGTGGWGTGGSGGGISQVGGTTGAGGAAASTTEAGDEGGCGCRAAPRSRPWTALVLLGFAALALSRRRR